MREYPVEPGAAGERLDVFLTGRLPDVSRSQVQHLVDSGAVTVASRPVKPSYRLRAGDVVRVAGPLRAAPRPLALVPEEIPLDVVYEDESLLVVDKPAGMVVHPAPGHSSGTLVHALVHKYPELLVNGEQRPGIVHRLDKDTSGLMLVARTPRTLRYLQDEIRRHKVVKEYTLLACGRLSPAAGRIEAPIARDPRNRLRMAIVATGRPALTEYETVSELPGYTLALARLVTGRTHQIRIHFSAIGHPLAGDPLYGRCRLPGLGRQFLHSSRLSLTLPTGEQREWHSALPADLQEALATVRPATRTDAIPTGPA